MARKDLETGRSRFGLFAVPGSEKIHGMATWRHFRGGLIGVMVCCITMEFIEKFTTVN